MENGLAHLLSSVQMDLQQNQKIKQQQIQSNVCSETCDLCSNKFQSKIPKSWKNRMILVFNLMEKASGRSWQNLKDDVIPYLERHWSYFWPSGEYPKKKRIWQQSLYDSLCHNKNIFESSQRAFRTKGFWRLRLKNRKFEDLPPFHSSDSGGRFDGVPSKGSVSPVSEVESSSDTEADTEPESEENESSSSKKSTKKETLDLEFINFPLQKVPKMISETSSFQVWTPLSTGSTSEADRCLARDFEHFLKRHNIYVI